MIIVLSGVFEQLGRWRSRRSRCRRRRRRHCRRRRRRRPRRPVVNGGSGGGGGQFAPAVALCTRSGLDSPLPFM